MKNDNFYKTLRIVCLILAIVCMALSLFKKAKAAEHEYIDDYFWNNYFLTDLQTYNVDLSSYNSYLSIIKDQSTAALRYEDSTTIQYRFLRLPDYAGYYMQGLSWSGGAFRLNDPSSTSYNPCILQNHELAFYNGLPNNFTFGVSINIGKNGQVQFRLAYTSRSTKDSQMNRSGHIIPINESIEINSNIVASVSETVNTNNLINGSTNTQHPEIYYSSYENWISTGLIVYGDLLVMSRYNDGYPAIINENYVTPPSTNTEGFDVYKYGTSGSERLVCDFTDCISISFAVGNSSNISLTLEIDNIESTINFDSTSEYYQYDVERHEAKYSFPYSTLGITAETVNAKLINVNIENITSSPGGSTRKNIVWVTPILLYGSDYEDLEPEHISKDTLPDYEKFDDPATQTSYNLTTNRWLTSASSTFDYSLFTRWNFSPKYLIIGVEPYGASQALKDSLVGFLRSIANLEFGNALDIALEVGQGKTVQDQITEFINENLYITDLYDILVFGYLPSENGTMQYYIYTTDSYNNHLNNSLMYDLLQAISDDGKALDTLYNYLYDRLDDFEEKSLNKFNEMVGLGEVENDLLTKIYNRLKSILDAILNLNIEIPEADYTDILSKLDTIIDNQDTSDINDDWYQNYREWLYGINENDNYLSPHEYFYNIFGTLKTTFDSFTNNISFNAYLLKVEDFINHISGSTTDNLTIYLRDGIGDPGFNINNNYMYTVGGS